MAAATSLAISVSEYLHTSYRPGRDYVGGEIEEEGEIEHCRMGIRNVRIVDPAECRGCDYSSGSWTETLQFTDEVADLHVDLSPIFAAIDQDRAQ